MAASLKEHITGVCNFEYYRDSQLWYRAETGLLFPVPIEDIGSASFRVQEKAILMMRYIRKYLHSINA